MPRTPPRTNTSSNILDLAFKRAGSHLATSFVRNARIREDIDFVCRCPSNRAGVRMLMACLLASLSDAAVDIRKPFKPRKGKTGAAPLGEGAGGAGHYSGRRYDEDYVGPFVIEHKLPVNATTSFLTPGYRTNPITLTRDAALTGKPQELYDRIIEHGNFVRESGS